MTTSKIDGLEHAISALAVYRRAMELYLHSTGIRKATSQPYNCLHYEKTAPCRHPKLPPQPALPAAYVPLGRSVWGRSQGRRIEFHKGDRKKRVSTICYCVALYHGWKLECAFFLLFSQIRRSTLYHKGAALTHQLAFFHQIIIDSSHPGAHG